MVFIAMIPRVLFLMVIVLEMILPAWGAEGNRLSSKLSPEKPSVRAAYTASSGAFGVYNAAILEKLKSEGYLDRVYKEIH